YWVMDRADDYSWAIVGEGSGKYLWLLTRKPPTDLEREALTARAKAMGYDTAMLRPTLQPAP
ncbi:MAG TPA: lipocalin family protein, partial [Caulobacter sp.]